MNGANDKFHGPPPEPLFYADFSSWLLKDDHREQIESHLRKYFEPKSSKTVWHGQHFEWFAARINRSQITEIDIAAIGTLSVRLPAQTTRELIEDQSGRLKTCLEACEEWLSRFGEDFSITQDDSSWLENDQPFNILYRELRRKERYGLGSVVASKLMAARYPRLIPIRDSRVEGLLGMKTSVNWWAPMRELAIQVDPILSSLKVNRDDIEVTNLRKLDVILWMEATERGF